MEFTDVVLKRRMVRNFTAKPVEGGTIERILDLARHAPSAGFTQGQSFVVVTDPRMRKEIGRVCGEEEYEGMGVRPLDLEGSRARGGLHQ